MQQYADIYLMQSHSTCFGCHSTHLPDQATLEGRYYYLYRRLRLQFLVLLMMGAVTPETCSDFAVNKYLLTDASGWTFTDITSAL